MPSALLYPGFVGPGEASVSKLLATDLSLIRIGVHKNIADK